MRTRPSEPVATNEQASPGTEFERQSSLFLLGLVRGLLTVALIVAIFWMLVTMDLQEHFRTRYAVVVFENGTSISVMTMTPEPMVIRVEMTGGPNGITRCVFPTITTGGNISGQTFDAKREPSCAPLLGAVDASHVVIVRVQGGDIVASFHGTRLDPLGPVHSNGDRFVGVVAFIAVFLPWLWSFRKRRAIAS